MIIRAAVCPGAPLLVPGLAPALAATVPALVAACRRAVQTLLDADRLLLVASGPGVLDGRGRRRPQSVVHRRGVLISSAVITGGLSPVHLSTPVTDGPHADGPQVRHADGPQVRHADGPDADGAPGPTPGVGAVVGCALLEECGSAAPLTVVELGDSSGESDAEFAHAVEAPERVAILVVAEGSADRGPDTPDAAAAVAGAVDAALGRALADGDPDALVAAVARAAAAPVLFTSGPALTALATLHVGHPPSRSALLYDGAPLGVGYLVATWAWD